MAQASGELAWHESDALRVVDWAAQNDVAVLGGEVWAVSRDGSVSPIFAAKDGSRGVYVWSTESIVGEARSQFVARCSKESRDSIQSFRASVGDLSDKPSDVVFNLTFDCDAD